MTTNLGIELVDAIKSRNAVLALSKIQEFQQMMKSVDVGAAHVLWISEPVNLTAVHKALVDELSIPQRLLAIKRMKFTRTQRAIMLMQAMENAVKRVHNL
jgi:hypothetical protein